LGLTENQNAPDTPRVERWYSNCKPSLWVRFGSCVKSKTYLRMWWQCWYLSSCRRRGRVLL